jgi:hypothetical protein
LYKSFEKKDQLSYSCFYKYLKKNKQFKKPIRFSDLCEYCEWARNARKRIKIYLTNFPDFKYENVFEEESFKLFLETKLKELLNTNSTLFSSEEKDNLEKKKLEIKNVLDDLLKYHLVMEHRRIAKIQRNAYNAQRKNIDLLRNKILIDVDFKQKITIGLSPRQVSTEYYEQEKRTCLGNKKQIKSRALLNTLFFSC